MACCESKRMTRIVIGGILGRMGSRVAALAKADQEILLVGGVVREIPKAGTLDEMPLDINAIPLMEKADVLIEFGEPKAALKHLAQMAHLQKPAVVGTTGFNPSEIKEIESRSKFLPIILESNFSLGIAFLKIALAAGLKNLKAPFDCEIVDIHRKGKKDAPSGTAKDLAQTLRPLLGKEPSMSSLRMGEVPGEHLVHLATTHEMLTFSHRAFSWDTYALGALAAAKWIQGKKAGLYRFSDALGG